jgi:hypothetical protein
LGRLKRMQKEEPKAPPSVLRVCRASAWTCLKSAPVCVRTFRSMPGKAASKSLAGTNSVS